MKPVDEQLAVISRGIDKIIPEEELRKKLAAGRPLRVKLGIDPTGFDVHLGHTVVLRKLRRFQQLGHQVVLIIGTATAQVGDPSGRDESRKSLTPEQIEKNAGTYLTQIAKVIDVKAAEVRPNGEWFAKWGFAEMLRLLGRTTLQQIIAREDFHNRFTANPSVPIYLHECLYPLMQGWDSVETRADVELGGTEQLFNLMVGRDLQREEGQEPQICLTMPILRGTDGVKKMGKTAGNYVGLNEPAKEQFGKTMRIPDGLMKEWFTLLTDRPADEIGRIVGGHPNEAKKQLAGDVVTFYHGPAAAAEVLSDWKKQFAGGGPAGAGGAVQEQERGPAEDHRGGVQPRPRPQEGDRREGDRRGGRRPGAAIGAEDRAHPPGERPRVSGPSPPPWETWPAYA